MAVGLHDLPDSVLQLIAQNVICFNQRCAPLQCLAFRDQCGALRASDG